MAAAEAPARRNGGAALEPAPLEQARAVADLSEDEGAKWYVFKVDASLDWRAALDGGRLRLGAEGPELLRSGEVGDGGTLVAAADAAVWPQMVPLRPREGSGHKLRAAGGGAPQVVRILKETKQMRKAEKAVSAARRKAAQLARRREELEIRRRDRQAKSIERWQAYIGLPPLDALGGCGGGDPAGGGGSVPEAEGAADPGEAVEAADGEPMLHLKPVSRAGDQGDVDGIVLAEFGECGLTPDAWSQLHFKRCQLKQEDLARGRRTLQLSGGFTDAKSLKLRGRYVPQPRENQQTSDCRYLVGLQGTGSRRLYIAEAELYSLERVLPEAEAINSGDAKKSFTELRTKAVQDLGTSTAARQQTATVKQREQEVKAADFGAIAASLGERAQAQQDSQVSMEERLNAATRRVMPKFDAEALSPKEVWAPALDQLAPQSCRAEVPVNEKLFRLLRSPPQKVLDQVSGVEEACPNCFVREILLSLARNRKENDKKVVATEAKARDLEFYLTVVECLYKLFAHKRTKRPINIRTAAECAGLQEDSEILRCWFDFCFEPVPGRRPFEKKLSCRKLLIAVIILGLCQTPDASMALPKDVEDDLCSGPHSQRKYFMNELEAMGGYAKKLAKGSDTLLIGLKSVPQEKVFIQNPAGRKRKREAAA